MDDNKNPFRPPYLPIGRQAGYDILALKSVGFMKQKEKDLFSVRLRIVGGHLKAHQLRGLAEIADRYGQGKVHLTTRQGVEIPYVHFENLEKVREELAPLGLEVGACGPRVRTVTACQGELCSHGLIESQRMAQKIDEYFFGQGGIPHKFKIGITGCPNSCIKPQENDLGIMGVVKKRFHEDLCNWCLLCEEICPVGAIVIQEEKLRWDEKRCIRCAECILVCPTEAWEKEASGYAIFVGGRMGKSPILGTKVFNLLSSDEAVLKLVEKTLSFYSQYGKRGERFGQTLERVGIDLYREKVS